MFRDRRPLAVHRDCAKNDRTVDRKKTYKSRPGFICIPHCNHTQPVQNATDCTIMYDFLSANWSASKGAVTRWVTINFFSFVPKLFLHLLLDADLHLPVCSRISMKRQCCQSRMPLSRYLCIRLLCIRYCKAVDVPQAATVALSASASFAPCCTLHLPCISAN